MSQLALFLLLLPLICGCRSMDVPSSSSLLDDGQLAKVQASQEGELKRSIGGRLRYHRERKTVAHADTLRIALSATSSLSSALVRILLRYPSLFGSVTAEQFDSVDTSTSSDGSRYVTLRQQVQGVAIWGTFLRAYLDKDSIVRRIVGHTVPLLSWRSESVTPTHSSEAARQKAVQIMAAELPQVVLSSLSPRLYFLPTDKRLRLVYRVEVSGQDGDIPLRQALFVSAHELLLVTREDLVVATDVPTIASGKGVGVLGESVELSVTQRGDSYSLEDLRRGSLRAAVAKPSERLPGRTVQSGRADGWDAPHAVSAFAHLATLWDYFSAEHRYFGWDGAGHGIVVATHSEVRFPPVPVALFDGQRLVLGAGSLPELLPAGGAFDVVAHEYVHAFIRATADLATEGESGAIDEGLANAFACLIEHALGGPNPNWTVGEAIYRPRIGTAALADLEDPERTEQSRSYAQAVPEAITNLSSPMITGRSQRRFRAGYIGHIGFLISRRLGDAKTARLLFRAVTTYLHRYAEAEDLADALTASASDLFVDPAPAISAVQDALSAVGVQGYLR